VGHGRAGHCGGHGPAQKQLIPGALIGTVGSTEDLGSSLTTKDAAERVKALASGDEAGRAWGRARRGRACQAPAEVRGWARSWAQLG